MTDRSAVISREQRAVDRAYACDARQAPPLDDLDGAALVIARLDVQDDDETGTRTVYLGRRRVRDETGDLLVINWDAPQAIRWRLARQDDPRDVRLHRQLRCTGGRVDDYSDVLVAGAARHGTDAGTIRDFLLEDLERARDGRMRDIVETIQRAQLLLVADDRPGVLVIQGGPGTGKTAVGLHRISRLLFERRFGVGDVLVVGPHQGFLGHVRDVLPQLGHRTVQMLEMDRLWNRARGSETVEARRVKSDLRMAEVLARAVRNLVDLPAMERHLRDGELVLSVQDARLAVPRAEHRPAVSSTTCSATAPAPARRGRPPPGTAPDRADARGPHRPRPGGRTRRGLGRRLRHRHLRRPRHLARRVRLVRLPPSPKRPSAPTPSRRAASPEPTGSSRPSRAEPRPTAPSSALPPCPRVRPR
ncbi:hypothetical protein [Actinomadura flavalba]|uniref:hypothetical protein n=1 Tax=Actinomadura flavalba TaxID=1120938 RepID=UPI0003A0022D|nr:hypothetical protein [Actinomadura flavalba]